MLVFNTIFIEIHLAIFLWYFGANFFEQNAQFCLTSRMNMCSDLGSFSDGNMSIIKNIVCCIFMGVLQ